MTEPEAIAEVAILEAKSPELGAILRRCLARALPAEEAKRRNGEFERTARIGALAAMGIPEPIRARLALGIDEGRKAVLAAIKATSGGEAHRLICLTGPSGCGKTTAACWLLSFAPGGRFVMASHLAALREAVIADRDELHQLQRAPAVVVDDLGRGSETDADRLRIGDYLCERADAGLLTVCTTLATNRLNYGESVRRRMAVRTC